MPRLLGQLHIELAVDRTELGLWSQIGVLVKARVPSDVPRQLLGMLNDTRDGRVNLLSHFVQEVGHLGRHQRKFIRLQLGLRGNMSLTGLTNQRSPPSSNQPRWPPQEVVSMTPYGV